MMRTTLLAFAAATLLAGTVAVPEARAQEDPDRVVYVKGRGEGRGLTRSRDGECFVIAPDHVVRGTGPDFDEDAPESLYVTDSEGRRIDATLEKPVRLTDLVILRIDATHPRTATLCAPWPALEGIPAALDTVNRARMEGRTWSGGAEWLEFEVTHVHAETFIVHPARGERRIETGMSGSLVHVGGVPAGILADRVADGPSGTVYRLDYLEGVLGVTLRSVRKAIPPPAGLVVVSSLLLPGGSQALTERVGKGALWAGATVALAAIVREVYQPVIRQEVHPQQFGPPRSYSYRDKDYVLRDYWPVVWLASGAWSLVDARRYIHDNYRVRARPQPGAPPGVSMRVVPRPVVVDGEPALAVTVEFSF